MDVKTSALFVEPSNEDEWIDQAREDFEAVFDAYITSEAWTNKLYGPMVMAAALRPCLPVAPRTLLYLVGKRRSGKQWTAWTISGFWQSLGGIERTDGYLQGGVWVTDDVAPDWIQDQDVDDLHRAIADFESRALVVVAAEDEPSDPDVAERAVTLRLKEGALGGQDQTRQVELINSAPGQAQTARLAGAFIRWINARKNTRAAYEGQLKRATNTALTFMPRSDAELAADLMVTWYELADFAELLGVRGDILKRVKSTEIVEMVAELVASRGRWTGMADVTARQAARLST